MSFEEALHGLEVAFASGDIESFAALLADDIVLMLHNQETIAGTEGVRNAFAELFDNVDTSAYLPSHHTVEVIGDRAFVISEFTETLRPYGGTTALAVQGRAVFFWRRGNGGWTVTRMLTARSAPDRQIHEDE